MGWRDGVSDMMGFLANYFGNQDLMKQKAKLSAQASAEEEQNKMLRELKEYNLWTNPDDPVRKLLMARQGQDGQQLYPNLPVMKGIKPQDWLKLKAMQRGGGGGGFFFGGGGGVGGGGGAGGPPEI